MNPIFYLLLIAISGGVLAIVLVIFIVGFCRVAGDGGPLFSQWRKDSIVQRSAAAEWMQRAAVRSAGESSNEPSKIIPS